MRRETGEPSKPTSKIGWPKVVVVLGVLGASVTLGICEPETFGPVVTAVVSGVAGFVARELR